MDNYLEAAPIANRTAGVGASPPARGMRSPLRPPQLAPGPPQVTARLPPPPHPDLAASPSLLTATRLRSPHRQQPAYGFTRYGEVEGGERMD